MYVFLDPITDDNDDNILFDHNVQMYKLKLQSSIV